MVNGVLTNCGSNSTGDAFADALLGNFNTLGQNSAVTTGQFRFNDFEAYGQDTWRATRKLSLVLGVRYIHTTPTYTEGNNITNFNPFAFNPALEPTFTGGLATSSINPASPGLCSGPLHERCRYSRTYDRMQRLAAPRASARWPGCQCPCYFGRSAAPGCHIHRCGTGVLSARKSVGATLWLRLFAFFGQQDSRSRRLRHFL